MNKEILNSLNTGEKLVEMIEFSIHNITVFKVIVYTCKKINIFNKHIIDKFEYPFYFKTKQLAEEFLKYWDKFWITNMNYWDDGNKHCFGLYIKDKQYESNTYIMVDDYKKSLISQWSSVDKSQLTYNGIWNGKVCTKDDGRYCTYDRKCFNYKGILDRESVGVETNKTYIFKMIKEN